MACVWKLPANKSPFWIGQFTGPDGRRINRSTKQTDRRKAQTVADTWEKAARKARLSELTQAASVKILGELLEATTGETLHVESIAGFLRGWIASRESLGRADATARRYRSVIESFLAHLSGPRAGASIASLSAGEIEAWRNAELQSGKGATTADFGLKVLRAALNAARRKGLALANPAEAVEAAGGAAETREPFTAEEVVALLNLADKEWRGMILLGAWCGLRIADAANLTWASVNLRDQLLSFQPAKTRNKQAAPLILAMSPELVEHLSTLTPGVGKAPLFPSLHGRKPGSHGGLSNEFSRLMGRAGVMVRKGREKKGAGRQFNSKGFHSFRHTMISRMANANTPPDVRRSMVGHSSDAIHRKYVHLNLETQRKALAALPAFKAA